MRNAECGMRNRLNAERGMRNAELTCWLADELNAIVLQTEKIESANSAFRMAH
jgi:hypothetical protein